MHLDPKTVYETVCGLAEDNGVTVNEYLASLAEQTEKANAIPDGLPEEIVRELTDAREAKKQKREDERKKSAEAGQAEEIKRFRELFPGVNAETIPDEVWEDVAAGIPLSYAYAYRMTIENEDAKRAEETNRRNSEKGAAAKSEGSVEPGFTMEQVEKMDAPEVRRNYKGIIKAMKNWRIN